jgi:acetate kinase
VDEPVTPPHEQVILCVNTGSSSLKFKLFVAGQGEPRAVASGKSAGIGSDAARSSVRAGNELRERRGARDHAAALADMFALLEEVRAPAPTAVGHRVVHGGPFYVEPTLLDASVIAGLGRVIPMAPLHMPAAIAGIEAVAARDPRLPQVACFDTAFFASMPEHARRLPLPESFDREGVRRYGFHGLSYEFVVSALGPEAPVRLIVAHLGSGSSLAAIRNGHALETTMGFTPLGGVLMGTRSGDLDPGLVLYLLREKGMSVDALERLLDRESGILAIGGTADVKLLVERAATDPRAELALAMFAHSVQKAVGALAAVLGGVDRLVFTGGIGENSAEVRKRVCEGLEPLGVTPDRVAVVATDEELVIARHAARVMGEVSVR